MGPRAAAVLAGFCCFLGSGVAATADSATAEQANLQLIHAQVARQAASDCSGSPIAVLDSGVDAANRHLAGAVLRGWNALTNSSNTTDTTGHGTRVAGVIAGHNGLGGICHRARILPVVVWAKDIRPTDTSIAAGIAWATRHGARVINLSLGGTLRSRTLGRAIAVALAHDVVIVAAAGNTGSDEPQYPAAYPGVVAVSGTDSRGALAPFSSFGSWIALAAPAMRMLSTAPGGGIVASDGTSFAAPLVSAAAALVRTQHPAWTRTQVVRQLEQTADDAGSSGVDPAFGHGILDVAAAVGAASPVRVVAGPSDRFEPNDLPATAAPLAIGSRMHATLSPEGDADWYSIAVATPTDLSIVSPLDRGTSLIVDAFGPDLRLLAHRDARWDSTGGTLRLSFPAATPGRYFVRVSNAYGGRGAYRLSIGRAPLSHWAAWQDIYTGAEGSAVAVGDVTGDGRADVLMTTTAFSSSRYAGQLLLFAQQPDGTLGAPEPLPRGAFFCCSDVAIGDLNGDGRLDAVATLGSDGIETFSQHDGGLTGPHVIPTTSAATAVRFRGHDLLVTEIDGLHLLRRTTTGFTDVRVGAAPASAPGAVPAVRADFDGDGRPDLAIGNTIHYATGVTEWDGCDQVGIGPHTLAAGDVNGDGRTDLVWAGPFGLVVVLRESSWSGPGPWVAGVSADAVRFARAIDPRSLSPRTVELLDAHGNRIAAAISFDAATNTLTFSSSSHAAQIRINGIRDSGGHVLTAPVTVGA